MKTVFLRVLEADDKAAALRNVIVSQIAAGTSSTSKWS